MSETRKVERIHVGLVDGIPRPKEDGAYVYYYDYQKLERDLATAREAALEEAAKVCDARRDKWNDHSGHYEQDDGLYACEADACAEDIRTLKTAAKDAAFVDDGRGNSSTALVGMKPAPVKAAAPDDPVAWMAANHNLMFITKPQQVALRALYAHAERKGMYPAGLVGVRSKVGLDEYQVALYFTDLASMEAYLTARRAAAERLTRG